MFGLTERDLDCIKGFLNQYPSIERALIFGSRALGNHKRGSDIDLVLLGPVDFATTIKVTGRLNEEARLPYKFDVLSYDAIDNEALKQHIDDHAKQVYAKPSSSCCKRAF